MGEQNKGRADGRASSPASPLPEEVSRISSEVLKNGRAVLTPTGTTRFIDRRQGLATRVYYHGLLPREDISKMLKENGSFIVRTTSVADVGFDPQKCLSVRWDGKVRHFLLQKNSRGFYSVDKFITKFKSVEDLVDHYLKTSEAFSPHNCKLITPIGRMKWEFRHSQIELKDKLGEGMFGEVYSGFLTTKRERFAVAIKTLKCSHVTKEKIEESMREARLLRECRHPNIVRFYGVAAEEEPLMMIMEIVSGGSLDSYLEQKGAEISVDERIRMCCQAALAIHYLHAREILHRSQVKLQMRERLLVRWMPPEVFRTQVYTRAADVWALGVLIWEIFNNGAEPYTGWTGAQIKYELQEHNFRLSLPSWAPDSLKDVLKKIWASAPENRLTSAQAADALNKILPRADLSTSVENYKFLKEIGENTFGASLEIGSRNSELNVSDPIDQEPPPVSEYNDCAEEKKSAHQKVSQREQQRDQQQSPNKQRKLSHSGRKKCSGKISLDTPEKKEAPKKKKEVVRKVGSMEEIREGAKDKRNSLAKAGRKEENGGRVLPRSKEPVIPPPLQPKSAENVKEKAEKDSQQQVATKKPSKKATMTSSAALKKKKKEKYYEQAPPSQQPDNTSPQSSNTPVSSITSKESTKEPSTSPAPPPLPSPPSPPPPTPTMMGELEKTQEFEDDVDQSRDSTSTTTTTTTKTEHSANQSKSMSPESSSKIDKAK